MKDERFEVGDMVGFKNPALGRGLYRVDRVIERGFGQEVEFFVDVATGDSSNLCGNCLAPSAIMTLNPAQD